jgi:hypothetical protein
MKLFEGGLTPLGAAYVEALPDRRKARRIVRRFRETGSCPVSGVFPTLRSVREWYDGHPDPRWPKEEAR